MSEKRGHHQKQPKPNYAFIDSQNLNLGIQKNGWKMDWRKLRTYLRKEHNVQQAYMFIGYMQEHEAMYEQLHEAGYLIVLKPTVSMHTGTDESKKTTIKGNIDAELVLYAMKELPNYQQAVIISGDGDFYCLAEYLASKNRLKHIMTPNRFYSTLLRPYEDHILRLDKLKSKLQHIDAFNQSKKNKQRSSKNEK